MCHITLESFLSLRGKYFSFCNPNFDKMKAQGSDFENNICEIKTFKDQNGLCPFKFKIVPCM